MPALVPALDLEVALAAMLEFALVLDLVDSEPSESDLGSLLGLTALFVS